MLRTPDLIGCALEDRYELHALIGEGAFGRVYAGTDRRLARPVAVKVIKPWWAQDSEWVRRFESEAQLLARVNDPGIVQIFDFGHAEEGPYYVAELIDGESLADRLAGGALAPAEAARIAEQLCRALGSAHAQGIVHCDVKPANVMLTPEGAVKVGDFGVARLAEGTSRAMTAEILGTPRYMSPEQARGRANTPATDVYSAGVVLYEMLAGRTPFDAGSAVELGIRHLQDAPPPLPDIVPPELQRIVMRALAKEPAERYKDGAEMAAALHAGAPPAKVAAAADVRRRTPRAARRAAAVATDDNDTSGEGRTVDLGGAPRATPAPTRPLPNRPDQPPGSAPLSRHRGRYRARLGAIAVVALALGAAVLLLIVDSSGARTTVPRLRGLPAGGVSARARRTHLRAIFSERHSSAPVGLAIAQSPSSGARVAEGSTVRVVLSSGPPPVQVPSLVGEPSSSAESSLAGSGLHYAVTMTAAPGSTAREVVQESPAAGVTIPSGSTVTLSVAEAPRWRALTTFTGVNDGQSVPFRILGEEWRLRYSMSYQGVCLLIIKCFGPSAEATNLADASSLGEFELSEGSSQTHTFTTGPGLYRVTVSGGEDAARWSMTVEDHY